MKTLIGAALLLGVSLVGREQASQGAVRDAAITGEDYPAKLSDYGFFTDLKARAPHQRLIGYDLETALFSDYAEKERYIYLPSATRATYQPDAVFDLPVGAALIKSFGYRRDGQFQPLETRLLLHRASGWVALPYVWNADGSDAELKRAGTRIAVQFADPSGDTHQISYAVPNQNQCKDCHAIGREIAPIGIKARYLNHSGQLQQMVARKMLDRVPADAPRVPRWDDASASLDARARAYLEINCAHCHNPKGGASNSGLFLEWGQSDANALGFQKRPIAAGRGSGGREFAIARGDAEASILIYRMKSTDPGIAMPELGRATVHTGGVAMLSEWINRAPKR